MKNLILDTDSYKYSHYLQYPDGTTNVSSYIEARNGPTDEIVFFGLQAWLKETLSKSITQDDVTWANSLVKAHGEPFNYDGFFHLVGKPLPLRIQAVREGRVIPPGNVLVQVTNTDPRVPWLTSFIETSLLRAVWYPTTVATKSREIKKVIKQYLEETGDPKLLPFKLHDFGARGVSSYESAKIGGLAHLVNFMGTDTVAALEAAREWYNQPNLEPAGYSIPAAEHSTITAWGPDNESRAYSNMIERFGGKGKLVAVVSDSYDIYRAVEHIWGEELREKVLASGATLVVRPDSGNPRKVSVQLLTLLGSKFGFDINEKGYKVLNPAIRMIWGDGIDQSSITHILEAMKKNAWSADNIAFGMGGALLQINNRDDLSFAMKANAISNDGAKTWRSISKNPVNSFKQSKGGRLALVKGHDGYRTVAESYADSQAVGGFANLLEDVWVNGRLLRDQSLAEVRRLAEVA